MDYRKILHIDMDAFFASVEQRDNPSLKGKAIAVGNASERGVVATCSYEARKFGVHSAMGSTTAKRLCPEIIFIEPRMDVYKEISHRIREIFSEFTDKVEPLSIDEAFLDVTEGFGEVGGATKAAKLIKSKIESELNLTATAGVSYNKFLAKTASGMNKPNGLTIIRPEEALDFIAKLPVEKFYGVGKSTADKMHRFGIYNGLDIRNRELHELTRLFGKMGMFLYGISRGVDDREVREERIRKSVGAESTFEKDLLTKFERIAELYRIEQEVFERIQKSNFKGKTLTLKVKFHDFTQISRSKTITVWFDRFDLIHKYSKILLQQCALDETKIRLLGLSVSNSEDNSTDATQLNIHFK